ncbi:MAG: aromatic ring-hydroxylating dioxygenase subunit alpha [Planctomycetota bacterium]|nr:aromatic ring-hydroxylating dioxygenase subunit alpha [Planctomycetota bacterium]
MQAEEIDHEIERFDSKAPIEAAWTPPSSWYTDADFLVRERETVFRRSWLYAGRVDELTEPGSHLAVDVLGDGYFVVRGEDGELRGFHNVCRHHAARLVEGHGCKPELVCPYHGWTYSLDGALTKAPRSAGLADFERESFGLVPIEVETWGPWVFLHAGEPAAGVGEKLADLTRHLDPASLTGLRRVASKSYTMRCNWKVFVDNYLDGGYHIAHLHHGLASQLDLSTYETELLSRSNVQTCRAHAVPGAEVGKDYAARMGAGAIHAWIYPNLMLNRYGPALDTNLVVPLAHDRCEVLFDFWFEGEREDAEAFVRESLEAADETQQEDVWISERVQRGLASVAYDSGRYAPRVEHGMHHFHRLLAADLRASLPD